MCQVQRAKTTFPCALGSQVTGQILVTDYYSPLREQGTKNTRLLLYTYSLISDPFPSPSPLLLHLQHFSQLAD